MRWRIVRYQSGQVKLIIKHPMENTEIWETVGMFPSEKDAYDHIRKLSGEEPFAITHYNPN